MTERVLVVDDNRDAADTLAREIVELGCEAKAVYDGTQAIEVAATFLPDMALIDLRMPGLDGYETASRIRKQCRSAYVILVAVTGWTQEESQRRAYDCGFDLYIIKPMSVETLRELLALLDPAIAASEHAGRSRGSGAIIELADRSPPRNDAESLTVQEPGSFTPAAGL